MKIDTLIISKNFPPIEGGIQTYMFELANNWKAGKPYILCELEKNEPSTQNVPFDIRRYKNKEMGYFKAVASLTKLLFHKPKKFGKAFIFLFLLFINRSIIIKMVTLSQHVHEILNKTSKPTIIQCSTAMYVGAVGMLAKILYNYPLVIYIHGTELNKYHQRKNINLLYKFIIRNADTVISNSHYTKDLAIKNGAKEENIVVFNLGANIHKYYPQSSKSQICDLHNISENSTILLTVSHLIERKGHELVLYALNKIVQKYKNIHYFIVGQGPNKTKLQNLVQELKLEKHVTFTGFIEDKNIPLYMNACDIFVMPNREINGDFEGFGIVFLEANACRKPVIGGRSGGVTDAVIDKETGLLISSNNIRELEDKIMYLIDNPQKADELAQRGYERVVNELNWESVVQKINQYLVERI